MSDQTTGNLSNKDKIDRAAQHEELRFYKKQQWAVQLRGLFFWGRFLRPSATWRRPPRRLETAGEVGRPRGNFPGESRADACCSRARGWACPGWGVGRHFSRVR
jgi:hypothetical protein